MKCRIRYQPNNWFLFGAPDPLPWRLDVPAGLRIARQPVPDISRHPSFESALRMFQYLLKMKKRGWLHR
jgi:hypothetical protein